MTTMEFTTKKAEEHVVEVPPDPDATVTDEPAFPDARTIIARVFAMDLERIELAKSSLVFAGEQAEWSEATLDAQAETLE